MSMFRVIAFSIDHDTMIATFDDFKIGVFVQSLPSLMGEGAIIAPLMNYFKS